MVGETWDNWRENISKTLDLSPESVTIYQMELPYNTVFSKDILGNQTESPVADWETKRAWVEYAFDQFKSAGYSVSSAYTVVKDPSKVNFSYRDNLWMGADLLATGVASFGHANGVHYQNLADLNRYYEAIEENSRLPLGRGFVPSEHQKLVRELILLLKRGYLDAAYFREKFGVEITSVFNKQWDSLVGSNDITIHGDAIRLTGQGLLRVDGLLNHFFEPQFQGVRYT
jgi:oxygen-independent coproporphyrinogen-3 oxidase